ncbi:hypothetical protein CA838_08830 [Eikenella corrodens]|nr:hypothetical protein CA838_08830 [Eikenella corrodens]
MQLGAAGNYWLHVFSLPRGIFCVGNPRKGSNLTVVSTLSLPIWEQKSAWKSNCQQPQYWRRKLCRRLGIKQYS